jgi:hypothetical protein
MPAFVLIFYTLFKPGLGAKYEVNLNHVLRTNFSAKKELTMSFYVILLLVLTGICGYVLGILHGVLFMPKETVKRIRDFLK